MSKHTMQDLYELQALPLDMKIRLTKQRIREWVRHFGVEGCYISFSGGKDSTVLLDIAREDYPEIKAMFVDTPTQYPELREFVQTFDNVDIVKPKISFAEVCKKYGFPLISKEVSECVQGARKYLTSLLETENVLTDRQTDRQTQTISILVRPSMRNGSISEQSNKENDTYINTRRTEYLERFDREAIRRNTRGGVRQKVSQNPRSWRICSTNEC